MFILIDLSLVAIIVYCTWRGFGRGLILSISGIIAIVVSLVSANIIASTYADDFTGVMKPFVTGIVESGVAKVTGVGGDEADSTVTENEAEDDTIVLTDEEKKDVFSVTNAVLLNIGFPAGTAENIAERVAQEADVVGSAMSSAVVDKLCSTAAYVGIFIVVFILVAIVFAVISNIINLTFGLPGLELINRAGGAVFGAVKGIMIVLVIAWAARFCGIVVPDGVLKSTILLEWLMNSNILISILGV